MSRAGVALIEVLISLVILASAGMSTVAYLSTVVHDRVRIEVREDEISRAERLLLAYTLLERSDLEQRLGARTVGDLLVWVDRPRQTLFRIAVGAVERPEVELIVTVVHRPEEDPDGST